MREDSEDCVRSVTRSPRFPSNLAAVPVEKFSRLSLHWHISRHEKLCQLIVLLFQELLALSMAVEQTKQIVSKAIEQLNEMLQNYLASCKASCFGLWIILPGECERKSTPFRPSKLPPLSILI
jgi:hypothetical protein